MLSHSPLSVKTTPCILAALFLFLCAVFTGSCSPGVDHANGRPSDAPDSSTTASTGEDGAMMGYSMIDYSGATDNAVKKAMQEFSPVAQVQALAALSIHIKDSLEQLKNTRELTAQKDSLVFMPYETRAYQAILAYKQLLGSTPPLINSSAGLLGLERTTGARDSSMALLPKAEKSDLLTRGNFFFLGGAPFITRVEPEENNVFSDALGQPETRFETTITENANYLLNFAYPLKNGSISVSFGPPLNSYDSGPQEVHGIGSLIHEFVNRVPVFFLTESGIIPAQLVSITLKLVPEGMGCISDQPNIIFACSKNISAKEILGIYIPHDSAPVNSFTLNRRNARLWTADLNNDGIPELACVSDTFAGIIDDALAEVIWFVNINGTWRILDWGRELDCT